MNKEKGWDASFSWNGYMYQGKVALLVALKKINESTDLEGYWLELEGVEDFSIGFEELYKSVHQVKNRQDNAIKDYREALSNIVKRIKDYSSISNGYLHTKNEIKVNDWKKEIQKELLDYYPEKIQQLEKIVVDSDIQSKAYDEILEKWNEKTKKLDRKTKDIYKLLIEKIEHENVLSDKSDITTGVFKSACEKVLCDEKAIYDFAEKKLAIGKIELFLYPNGNTFADSSDIIDMTINEIKKYWGESAEYREEKVEIYYIKLLNLINENITERAENSSKMKKILLQEFKKILDIDTAMICGNTKEEASLRLKYLYLAEKDEFCTNDVCEVKSEENCENCRLEYISNYILTRPLPQIESIFRIMSLHKKGELIERGFELFSKPELENTFFAGITELDKDFFIRQCKVLCQVSDKFMLATTIDAERLGRKKIIIKDLVQNDLHEVCHKIINNDEYDTALMEVDKLLTKNFDVEDIFKEACKINVVTENDDELEDKLKYMNITKTKKVSLISIKNAKEKYGERK